MRAISWTSRMEIPDHLFLISAVEITKACIFSQCASQFFAIAILWTKAGLYSGRDTACIAHCCLPPSHTTLPFCTTFFVLLVFVRKAEVTQMSLMQIWEEWRESEHCGSGDSVASSLWEQQHMLMSTPCEWRAEVLLSCYILVLWWSLCACDNPHRQWFLIQLNQKWEVNWLVFKQN